MSDRVPPAPPSLRTPPASFSLQVWGTHRSIQYDATDPLIWEDIPPLAILTGPNGAGKTHLLEGLGTAVAGAARHGTSGHPSLFWNITGFAARPHEVHFRRDPADLGQLRAVDVSQLRPILSQLIQSNQPSGRQHRELDLRIRHLAEVVQQEAKQAGLNPADWLEQNPGWLFHSAEPLTTVSVLFQRYRSRLFAAALKQDHMSVRDVATTLGPAPWDVLDEILATANFPYRVVRPENEPGSQYVFQVHDPATGVVIQPGDLSSGEQVIMSTILWLFGSDYEGAMPKLLLLDEPDAHLHPSLAKTLLDVLDRVLVHKHGVRVILTTHSPSTVALAPEDSIFVMSREHPRIQRAPSRWHAAALLSAGLVTVGPGAKHVFVEDVDDAEFFRTTLRILQTPRPMSSAAPALPPVPSFSFISAAEGRGSGGKTQVRTWVRSLEHSGIHGVIDGDAGNTPEDRVHVLPRYEHENYLIDPLVIYAMLVNEGLAPTIPGVAAVGITGEIGLPHRFPDELQRIADHILDALEVGRFEMAERTGLDRTRRSVRFIHGAELAYPEWFLQTKGKTYMSVIQSTWHRRLDWGNLVRAYERIAWVPAELRDLLARIQTA